MKDELKRIWKKGRNVDTFKYYSGIRPESLRKQEEMGLRSKTRTSDLSKTNRSVNHLAMPLGCNVKYYLNTHSMRIPP